MELRSWFRGRPRRVVIVAHNGATAVMTPTTASPETIAALSEAFTPLVVDGHALPDLTDLQAYVHARHGLPPVDRSKAARAIEVTNLNGVLLFNLLRRAGFDPILVNDLAYDDDVLKSALDGDVLAVVISTTFLPFREYVTHIARRVRAQRPDMPVVVGGPMVYTSAVLFRDQPPRYDREMLARLYFFFAPAPEVSHYVVDRHGLGSLVQLLQALRAGRNVDGLPNLAVADAAGIRFTRLDPEEPALEDEVIDWDAVPDEAIKHTVALRGSLGCPFKCKFCNFHFFAPKLVSKPQELLQAELDQLARRDVKRVSLVDDSMLLSRRRVRDFCRGLISREYPFQWSSFVRADSLAGENVDLVARSGGHLVSIGVESGDDKVLANMDKKLDRELVLEVVSGLGERGVSTSSTIIIGFPGEDETTVGNTIDLLNRYRGASSAVHWYYPFVFMMLPRVRVETERERYGLEGFMMRWRHDTMDAPEAARQVKRLIASTHGARFPFSSEHPFASEIMGLDPGPALRLVELVADHVRNQVLLSDGANPSLERENRRLFAEIEELLVGRQSTPGTPGPV